ncbi:hypothetical protein F5883DRAFT_124789 [Diaporthe sp. PMI_573]|nr:hypothetical protein F5883DRAFT_124789 [Diaporthaceae sp. PMI_573]
MKHIKQWYGRRLLDVLAKADAFEAPSFSDVDCLSEIILDVPARQAEDQREQLEEAVEHLLDIFRGFGSFITALVTNLFIELRDPNCVRGEFVRRALSRLLNDAISVFDYKSYRDYLGDKFHDVVCSGGGPKSNRYTRPGPFRDFYEFAKASGKDSEAPSRLLRRLQMQVSQARETSVYMAHYLTPLMGSLALALDTTSQDARSCFRSLAKACIVWGVGKEPPPPLNWARPDEVGICDQETESLFRPHWSQNPVPCRTLQIRDIERKGISTLLHQNHKGVGIPAGKVGIQARIGTRGSREAATACAGQAQRPAGRRRLRPPHGFRLQLGHRRHRRRKAPTGRRRGRKRERD